MSAIIKTVMNLQSFRLPVMNFFVMIRPYQQPQQFLAHTYRTKLNWIGLSIEV